MKKPCPGSTGARFRPPEAGGRGPDPRADKDTGLAKLPFRDFQMNAVWLELVGIAHDLIA